MEGVFEALKSWDLWAIAAAGVAAWYGLGWLIARLALGIGVIRACNLAAFTSTILAPSIAGCAVLVWRGLLEGIFVASASLLLSLLTLFFFARGGK